MNIFSGFARGKQPAALDRAEITALMARFVREEEIVAILRAEDPFLIAHDCINPAGHQPIGSCGEIVCRHCARIFW